MKDCRVPSSSEVRRAAKHTEQRLDVTQMFDRTFHVLTSGVTHRLPKLRRRILLMRLHIYLPGRKPSAFNGLAHVAGAVDGRVGYWQCGSLAPFRRLVGDAFIAGGDK